MGRFLTVFKYSYIRNWRDPATPIEQVLLPLALILVLGTALGGAFQGRDIGPTRIAYAIESETPAAIALRAFLVREDVAPYLEPIDAGSLERARELLAAQEVVSVLYAPAEFGTADGRGTLRVIERGGNALRTGVVRAVMRNFVLSANLASATADPSGLAPMPASFRTREISREGRSPGAFDFYSVSMLVLTLMYVAGYAADSLREDMLDPIGRRIGCSPIRPSTHLSAKLAANAAGGLSQALIIVVVTRIAFGTNWGGRPLLSAAVVGAMALFSVAFGAFVLAAVKDGQKAQSIINSSVLVSMIVSGGAVSFGDLGAGFKSLQRLLPHYQGQTAILSLVYGGSPGAAAEALVYFFIGAGAAWALASRLSRRGA